MTKYESETIINYNDEEGTATVYTCNSAMIRHMDRLCENDKECKVEKQDEYSKTYVLPKKWVKKPKPPKKMSEEQRQKAAERLRQQNQKIE